MITELDLLKAGQLGQLVTADWDPARLKPNPINPRGAVTDEMVADILPSVREKGILQRLTILPDGTIVIGHRRHHASLVAKLKTVPVEIRQISEAEQLEVMLIENIHRESLTPLQEARSFSRLLGLNGNNVSAVARAVGMPPAGVNARLDILKLPVDVQELFAQGQLALGAAGLLSKLSNVDEIRRLATFGMRPSVTLSGLEKAINAALHRITKPEKETKTYRPRERAQGATFDEVVKSLEENAETPLTFEILSRSRDRICCACGMAKSEAIRENVCSTCPLPQFLNMVILEARNAQSANSTATAQS